MLDPLVDRDAAVAARGHGRYAHPVTGMRVQGVGGMNDADDDPPADPGPAAGGPPAPAPWSAEDDSDDDDGGDDDGDESLRTFMVALAGLVGAMVVVGAIGLVTQRPRKNFIQRHPVLAELLGMGRHGF